MRCAERAGAASRPWPSRCADSRGFDPRTFGAFARAGAVFACAKTPPRQQPPAAVLEIAGVRRQPDEPLAAFLLRAHAEAQRRTPQPQPRYWWVDTDEG